MSQGKPGAGSRPRKFLQTAAEMVFLRAVVSFAEDICVEQGTLIRNERQGRSESTARSLRNHHDFTFYLETNRLLISANLLKVWHHPGQRFHKTMAMVLSLEWQGKIDRMVKPRIRSRDRQWEYHIRSLIRARDERSSGQADVQPASLPKGILGIRRHYLA